MEKKKWFNIVAIACLVIVMAATTSISFAYWKSGIEGNSANKGLNVIIGEGDSYLTTVDLSDAVSLSGGKRLVPVGRIVDANNQTDVVSFEVDVTWSPVASSTSHFEQTQGLLSVSCVRLYIEGTPDIELLDAKGYGGYNLFSVISDKNSYDILGTETKTITISISMNEPANREQYDLIAGKNIKISLEFKISSPDDLNQQIG